MFALFSRVIFFQQALLSFFLSRFKSLAFAHQFLNCSRIIILNNNASRMDVQKSMNEPLPSLSKKEFAFWIQKVSRKFFRIVENGIDEFCYECEGKSCIVFVIIGILLPLVGFSLPRCYLLHTCHERNFSKVID